MASARSAWGIDIGNRALKAVKLVREGDRLRVDDVEVIEHEQILSSAGDNKEQLVQTALTNFVQRHGTKGSVVGISTSGQSSFARFIKLPPVEPKKIPEIVKFEAIQQIPFPLEDVEWSYQLFQDPESPDIEVGIFAMRKELVNAQIKQFTDLEMNVQLVQMSPLAVYNGMYYDQHLGEGTTMIVDCGAENTDLIIADGETVWLRTISIGGNNFTEALTKSFKLNFPKAEELKRNAATSKYQRQIFQAMRPVFADFVSEIQRSIGFYGTVHRDARIKKIIALGSTFRLPTLQKYLQQNLQVDVERLDGFSGGAPTDGRLAALLNENLPSLGTAYGLAVQAMGDGKITSSLLPEQIRNAKVWKEKTPWFGLAAACFVLGTAGAAARWYLDQQAFESKAVVRSQIDSAIIAAQKADKDWLDVQEDGAPSRKRIQDTDSMQTGRDVWQIVTQDLGAALPAQPAEDVETIKKTPRGERKQIVVDSLSTEYQADMAKIVAMSDLEFRRIAGASGATGDAAAPPPAAPANPDDPNADPNGGAPVTTVAPGAGARGFVITLRCTTPNKGGSGFVRQAFVENLKKLDPKGAIAAKKPYYIAKATIVEELTVKNDTARKLAGDIGMDAGTNTAIQPGSIGGGGGGVGVGGGGGASIGAGGGNRIFQGDGAPPPGSGRGAVAPRPGAGVTPATMNPAKNAAAANPANPANPADPNAPVEVLPFPDPITGEDMSEDASLTVVIAIVLDPASAVPAAAPAGEAPPAAAASAVQP